MRRKGLRRFAAPSSRSAWLAAGIGVVLLCPSLGGCRSKLDIDSKKGDAAASDPGGGITPPPPESPPAPTTPDPDFEPEIGAKPPRQQAGALELPGGRFYYQSRSTIVLSVDAALLEDAPSFSLLNVTAGDNHATVLLDEEPVPDDMSLRSATFSLHRSLDARRVTLTFPPGSAARDQFVYGKNRLKLLTHDPLNPRFSIIELTLRDFTVFGATTLSTPPAANDGSRLEGWLNPLSQSGVAVGGHQLQAGPMSLVNPH